MKDVRIRKNKPKPQVALRLHRVREILINQRTMITYQLRGLLTEFGFTTPAGGTTLHNPYYA